MKPRIAVVGASRCDRPTREAAYRVGREIASRGALLLCGGGSGVMEAAARGARDAGGRTIGILPGSGPGTSPPNPSIEIPIYTGMGQARNVVLVLSADGVIAVGGEWGTLSEIAMARKHGRPVVLLDSWELTPPASSGAEPPPRASTPGEAVRELLALIARHQETA